MCLAIPGQVVFFAIGFETTAPSTALTLQRAKAEGIPNFFCFSNHVTIVPPLRAVPGCEEAAEIGEVKTEPPGMVPVETAFGGRAGLSAPAAPRAPPESWASRP